MKKEAAESVADDSGVKGEVEPPVEPVDMAGQVVDGVKWMAKVGGTVKACRVVAAHDNTWGK